MKHRIAYIDILKGILIILVVLGHLPQCSDKLHQWIFWFHMPAFFMLAGFFVKDNFSRKDEVISKFKRLVVPYLFFSLTLGTVGRNGNILKQLAGTSIGGNANITIYTYPYYFLTVLFFAYVLFYAMRTRLKWWKQMAIGVIVLYIASHLMSSFVPDTILGYIPWNIDMAMFAVGYLFVGSFIINKQLQFRGGGGLCLVISVIMSALILCDAVDYSFDFKHHNWTWGVDILVPFVFTMALLKISRLLDRIWGLRHFLTLTGQASMSILLLHPLFMKANGYLFDAGANVLPVLALNVAECLAIHILLAYFNCTRFLIGLPAKKSESAQ